MVRNILFDLGNVILDIDPGLTEKRLEEVTGLPFEEAFKEHRPIFEKFETGKFGYVVFFNYLTKIARKKALINDLLPAWNAMLLEIQPGTLEFLHFICREYNCYLLSNTNECHLAWFDKYLKKIDQYETWYSQLFTQCFYSHMIGHRKPENECFNHVLQVARILPGETLYIDDTPEHLRSAEALGFHTLLFDRHQDTLRSGVMSAINKLATY